MKTKRLTDAQMRVAIARDALKHLRARRLRIRSGYFMTKPRSSRLFDFGTDPDMQVDDALRDVRTCAVCGLGGLCYAGIMRHDRVTVNQIGVCPSFTTIERYLSKWFSRAEIRQIEAAYETGKGWVRAGENQLADYCCENVTVSLIERAVAFGKKYRSNVARFRAIMLNIIKNKGTFKP